MEQRICENCGNVMVRELCYWLCEVCGNSTKDDSDFKELGYVG